MRLFAFVILVFLTDALGIRNARAGWMPVNLENFSSDECKAVWGTISEDSHDSRFPIRSTIEDHLVIRILNTNRSVALVYRLPNRTVFNKDARFFSEVSYYCPVIISRDDIGGARIDSLEKDVQMRMSHRGITDAELSNRSGLSNEMYLEAINIIADEIERLTMRNRYGIAVADLTLTPEISVTDIHRVIQSEAAEHVHAYTAAKLNGDLREVEERMASSDKTNLVQQLARFPDRDSASEFMRRIASVDIAARKVLFAVQWDSNFVYGFRSTFPAESIGANVFVRSGALWQMATEQNLDIEIEFRTFSQRVNALYKREAIFSLLMNPER